MGFERTQTSKGRNKTQITHILVLLYLSSAFHTVDHNIWINHLKNYVGIIGLALDRLNLYLPDGSFCVTLVDASVLWCPPGVYSLSPLIHSLHSTPGAIPVQTWHQFLLLHEWHPTVCPNKAWYHQCCRCYVLPCWDLKLDAQTFPAAEWPQIRSGHNYALWL